MGIVRFWLSPGSVTELPSVEVDLMNPLLDILWYALRRDRGVDTYVYTCARDEEVWHPKTLTLDLKRAIASLSQIESILDAEHRELLSTYRVALRSNSKVIRSGRVLGYQLADGTTFRAEGAPGVCRVTIRMPDGTASVKDIRSSLRLSLDNGVEIRGLRTSLDRLTSNLKISELRRVLDKAELELLSVFQSWDRG
jgi:hypothetical protein